VKILISAAETSSDAHGAVLLRALQEAGGEGVQAFGIGGPKLQQAGLRTIVDAKELLVMGFTEILGRLPRIHRALNQLTAAAAMEKPDVAVVIDYPDFHFRLARRLRAQGVPVIYYIPPKVWVWRKGRTRDLREIFSKLLCVFPFEVPFYQREGVTAKYVGNPLLDELPLELTRESARIKVGLPLQARVLTLMTGSRPSEWKRHIPLMLDAAVMAAAHLRSRGLLGGTDPLRVLMPVPEMADFARAQASVAALLGRGGYPIINVSVSRGDAPECLVAADVALVKSGTSTLEAALLGVPHAVVYKPSLPTEIIFKYLIRYRGPVGLVNLVASGEAGWKAGDRMIASEILCGQATVKNLSDEIVSLFTDESRRARMKGDFAAMRTSFAAETGSTGLRPGQRAAREILELVGQPRRPQAAV